LPDLATALPSHTPVDTKGRGKLHGLVVMYRTDRFRVKASRTVYLDEERLLDKDGQEGRGGSRQTKNVGLIVGLDEGDGRGIVVATTHL
jgi:RNA exonuclease NGL2